MRNKRIEIGSQVFFRGYPDYVSHDKDYVEFQDNPTFYKTFANVKGKGNDIFYYKTMSKQAFLEYELKHCINTPMAAGKFLSPKLAEYINLTIDELKLFESAFENIDEKHIYEKVIYNSYIKNNAFVLTDEQRNEAYNLYKEIRKNKHR